MQSSQTVIPFARPDRERHSGAFNPQGRCWKSKHRVRSGEVVKVRPSHQSYPIRVFSDELFGEPVVIKCRIA